MKKGPIIAIVGGILLLLGGFAVIVLGAFWFLKPSSRAAEEADRVLKVEIPTATPEEEAASPELMIHVPAGGDVRIDGASITPKNLKQRLRSLASDNSNIAVRIKGDKDTRYQSIVEVIETCQQAGIWNISFATQGPEGAE